MIRKFFLPSLLMLITACGGSSTSVDNVSSEKGDLEPFYCESLAEVDEVDLEDEKYRSTTILNYELINRCLCIKYQYSGCHSGERILVWDADYDITNRPEVQMKLVVREAGMCDEIRTDSACFSMKRMKLVGNEVLVFINNEQQNVLLDFNTLPEQDGKEELD